MGADATFSKHGFRRTFWSTVVADNQWHVITGGPSVGKTSLLTALARAGHHTVGEAARDVIDEGIADGLTIEQIRADEEKFQEIVMRRKIDVEAKLDPAQTTFLDRGLHDTIGYNQFHGFEIGDWIWDAVAKANYRSVFLLSPLDTYIEDYARTENKAEAAELHRLLEEAYRAAGFTPIIVPAMPIKQRVDFVLRNIK